jgi:hypothetical protein
MDGQSEVDQHALWTGPNRVFADCFLPDLDNSTNYWLAIYANRLVAV